MSSTPIIYYAKDTYGASCVRMARLGFPSPLLQWIESHPADDVQHREIFRDCVALNMNGGTPLPANLYQARLLRGDFNPVRRQRLMVNPITSRKILVDEELADIAILLWGLTVNACDLRIGQNHLLFGDRSSSIRLSCKDDVIKLLGQYRALQCHIDEVLRMDLNAMSSRSVPCELLLTPESFDSLVVYQIEFPNKNIPAIKAILQGRAM